MDYLTRPSQKLGTSAPIPGQPTELRIPKYHLGICLGTWYVFNLVSSPLAARSITASYTNPWLAMDEVCFMTLKKALFFFLFFYCRFPRPSAPKGRCLIQRPRSLGASKDAPGEKTLIIGSRACQSLVSRREISILLSGLVTGVQSLDPSTLTHARSTEAGQEICSLNLLMPRTWVTSTSTRGKKKRCVRSLMRTPTKPFFLLWLCSLLFSSFPHALIIKPRKKTMSLGQGGEKREIELHLTTPKRGLECEI